MWRHRHVAGPSSGRIVIWRHRHLAAPSCGGRIVIWRHRHLAAPSSVIWRHRHLAAQQQGAPSLTAPRWRWAPRRTCPHEPLPYRTQILKEASCPQSPAIGTIEIHLKTTKPIFAFEGQSRTALWRRNSWESRV